MSADFVSRLIGLVVFCIAGVFLGTYLGELANIHPAPDEFSTIQYGFIFGLVGALVGLILTPFISVRPVKAIRSTLTQVSAQTLFAGLIGLVMGLLIAALLSFPISLLPQPFGDVLPFVGVVLFGYLGIAVFVMRQNDMFEVISSITNRSSSLLGEESSTNWFEKRTILLDTSVIIDGRIADIARTGFLPGSLIIPRFILNELQFIADSSDNLRRQRGRRGLDILGVLQKDSMIPLRISDIDVEETREADDKLVILARKMRSPILTNDYNLNRIAELQGVTVLNINELANAVKSVLLPGETLNIRVIQEGKEDRQGVGYMEDGTMVVIENGERHINRKIDVNVTKVLQTAAGRMIFAKPD